MKLNDHPGRPLALHICLREAGGGPRYASQLVDQLGADIGAALFLVEPAGLNRSPLAWFRAVRDTSREVRRTNASLLHAHGVRAGTLALSVGRLTRRPVVCTIHGLHSLRRSESRAIKAVNRAILRRMEVIFALSDSDRHKIESLNLAGTGLLEVLPPLFRFPETTGESEIPLSELPELPELPEGAFVALWVGRLDHEKDPELMIRILELTQPPIHAVIVGDGPLADRVTAAATRSPARSRLHLTGWVPSVDLVYQTADAYVSTSRWEGLPLTGLEAAASGLPILVTDAPGNLDLASLVSGATVFRTASEAAGQLEQLRRYDASERTKLRRAQASSVRAKFDPRRTSERVLARYRELLRSR